MPIRTARPPRASARQRRSAVSPRLLSVAAIAVLTLDPPCGPPPPKTPEAPQTPTSPKSPKSGDPQTETPGTADNAPSGPILTPGVNRPRLPGSVIRPPVIPGKPAACPASTWAVDDRVPPPHMSSEASRGCPPDEPGGIGQCRLSRLFGAATMDLDPFFPEWSIVDCSHRTVTLEGEVIKAHIAHRDMPINHYTHDFDFKVKPLATPDNRYSNLLGRTLGEVKDKAAAEPILTELRALKTELRRRKNLAVKRSRIRIRERTDPRAPGDVDVDDLVDWWQKNAARYRTLVDRYRALPRHEMVQEAIGVEWETGLGADNDGNICQADNIAGRTCGFFSHGHAPRRELWNWPTVGDSVHIVGLWVWDRGHRDPAELTEIHPPRLLAVRRRMLDRIDTTPADSRRTIAALERDIKTLQEELKGASPDMKAALLARIKAKNAELQAVPRAWVLGKRVDIFASGDGSALRNNRGTEFAKRVPMSDRDYSFVVEPPPRPDGAPALKWAFERRPGDSYPRDAVVTAAPDGDCDRPGVAHVHVTIPWKTWTIQDTAVFARTLRLWWDADATHGLRPDYRVRRFRVMLQKLQVVNQRDARGYWSSGEFRVFTDVAGHWLFLNELTDKSNILEDGLGDVGEGDEWRIEQIFDVYVPPGADFGIHASGWEADGANTTFGHLLHENHVCNDALREKMTNRVLDFGKAFQGCMDDPIGEVSARHGAGDGYGVGAAHMLSSQGFEDDVFWCGDSTDVHANPGAVIRTYDLHYTVTEASL